MISNTAFTKCPKCEANYSFNATKPENASDAEFWSDGYSMNQMKKDYIPFAKCPACSTYFWLNENSIPGPINRQNIKNLENSWSVDNISYSEIHFIQDAMQAGLANTSKKEIFLRIKLWHVINHINRKYDSQGFFKKMRQKIFETNDFKDSKELLHSSSSQKLNNLIRIANLLKLDKKENTNYVLFAEIYRELGDFSKALIFCHKAETAPAVDTQRIALLKQHITSKSKIVYKLL
jgi:hypothetical protein